MNWIGATLYWLIYMSFFEYCVHEMMHRPPPFAQRLIQIYLDGRKTKHRATLLMLIGRSVRFLVREHISHHSVFKSGATYHLRAKDRRNLTPIFDKTGRVLIVIAAWIIGAGPALIFGAKGAAIGLPIVAAYYLAIERIHLRTHAMDNRVPGWFAYFHTIHVRHHEDTASHLNFFLPIADSVVPLLNRAMKARKI